MKSESATDDGRSRENERPRQRGREMRARHMMVLRGPDTHAFALEFVSCAREVFKCVGRLLVSPFVSILAAALRILCLCAPGRSLAALRLFRPLLLLLLVLQLLLLSVIAICVASAICILVGIVVRICVVAKCCCYCDWCRCCCYCCCCRCCCYCWAVSALFALLQLLLLPAVNYF